MTALPPHDRRAARDELRALATAHTVLVVDDDQSIRELLSLILELEGYAVLQAASAADALDLLAVHQVDVITLDVMMPGLDGWGLAEELDRSAQTAGIPRVMISGKPLHELQAAPGSGRAAAVLSKPFDFAEVITIVQRLVAPARVPAQRQGEQDEAPARPLADEVPG